MKEKILTLIYLFCVVLAYGQSITLTTTSNSTSWSPTEVRNSGATPLRWQASNSKIGTLTLDINDPTFNFSANDGSPIAITITSSDGLSGLTRLYVIGLEISYFDVSKALNLREFSFSRNNYSSIPDFSSNNKLTRLYGFVNSYSSIDISNNPNLDVIYLFGLPIANLNIDNNPKLKYVSVWNNQFTPDVFDYIVKKIDEFGVRDGYLYIRDERTMMSELTQLSSMSFKNLKNKGWLIDIPQINITGLGTSISGDGSNAPISTDGTDFGSVEINGAVIKRTFTIENAAIHNSLRLTDPSPYIKITGDADFSLSVLPTSEIGEATDIQPSIPGKTTFEITFNPQTVGERNAIVSVKSNDPYQSNYIFNIKAEVTPASISTIDVTGNDISIVNSDSPNVENGTAFGGTVIGNPIIKTFKIKNIGNSNLTITAPLSSNNPYFQITKQPLSFIIPGSGTESFEVTFNPNSLGSFNGSILIQNNDPNASFFIMNISGKAQQLPNNQIMITQYYEGSTNSKWIEVINLSGSTIPAGTYFLAMYDQSKIPSIVTQAPTGFQEIPALAPGQVVLFSNNASTLPAPTFLGVQVDDIIRTSVCDFDGDDIILISTMVGSNCYANRVDMIGELTGSQWGVDKSFIRGGFSDEFPERDFNKNSWTELSIEGEVNEANTGSNIALGTQGLGPVSWNGTRWYGLTDRTRNVEINGPYEANNGSIVACNLTVNAPLNFDGGTQNHILLSNNLVINDKFLIGDEESLLTLNPDAIITGEITKTETSTPLYNLHDVTYWSAPVQNETIGHVFTGVDPNRIFYLNPAMVNPIYAGTIYGHWFAADGSNIMQAGRGYSVEGISTGEQLIHFRGKPNNGDLTFTVNYKGTPDADTENDNFNLVGNPYPSTLSVNALLSDPQNDNLEQTIYLWSHNTPVSGGGDYVAADYATYTVGTGGVAAGIGGAIPNGYLASSQGFMLRTTKIGNGLINFKNDHRLVDRDPVFFKSENKNKEDQPDKDLLWISLKSDQGGYNQILVGFIEGATESKDEFDGSKLKSDNPISLYSMIDNEKFAIQGWGPFSPEKEVVLGFDTDVAPRKLTLGIDKAAGIFNTIEVYLVDHLLGITHNISASPYNFEQTISGDFPNRFTLQFSKNSLDVEEILQGSEFSVFNSAEGFRINASKVVKEVKIYDMLGRTIMSSKPDQQSFNLNANNLKTGAVLIFEVKLENGSVLNKKVIRM